MFKLKDNKIENKLKHSKIFKEKEVQKFYEENLNKLLDAKLVETEFAFEGGRIDTFAIDSDNVPIIIEYKKNTNDSVLLQALFYKENIEKNWEKGYYAVSKKYGKEIADEVNWKNMRVIIVAQEFDKWTIAATSFIENVELYEFAFFEDNFFQIYVNAPKMKKKKIYYESNDQANSYKYPLVSEADFSKDEIVISSSGKESKTNIYQYNNSNKIVKEMYKLINDYIQNVYSNYEIFYNKQYWVFKNPNKFMEMIFLQKELIVLLDLKNNQRDSNLNIEDMSEKGQWGTLKSRIRIKSEDQLEELFRLIIISHKNVENL